MSTNTDNNIESDDNIWIHYYDKDENKVKVSLQEHLQNKQSELDKKDELIRKLIEDIENLCEHPLETWPTNRFNELSEREIQELLRIKQKQ